MIVDDRHGVTVHHGDCVDVMATLPDASVDAVVTDPPYGLANTTADQVAETITRWFNGERDYLPGGAGFMGKAWDAFVPPLAVWDECLRVLKPGGHLLAFAGSRTHDLMALGIRLAGFEVRDSIAWLYGSGFPKSLDVSKAIDKAAGAEREVITTIPDRWAGAGDVFQRSTQTAAESVDVTAPATDAARQWQGWGTALKPAHEPIVVARKPLAGTVAANVLAHGTGALNIDATRVDVGDRGEQTYTVKRWKPGATLNRDGGTWRRDDEDAPTFTGSTPSGRWPANVVLDEHAAAELDEQSGESASRARVGRRTGKDSGVLGAFAGQSEVKMGHDDSGGASRFFYTAKADNHERPRNGGLAHPTLKPLSLMRWLVRLVTPPGGTVLEPFAGSGTTVEACLLERFRCVAIEREADYLPLIRERIDRQRDPVAYVKAKADGSDDLGLFGLLDGEAS